MSCFRAALQLSARVKRSEVTELSVQNWGAKRLSFVPVLPEGLAGGEGCLAATGRQHRGDRCSNYCSDWCLAGWTMFRYCMKSCWVAETSAQMGPTQVLDVWGSSSCHHSEARIEGVFLCKDISGYICTWICFCWTRHLTVMADIYDMDLSVSFFHLFYLPKF